MSPIHTIINGRVSANRCISCRKCAWTSGLEFYFSAKPDPWGSDEWLKQPQTVVRACTAAAVPMSSTLRVARPPPWWRGLLGEAEPILIAGG